MKIESGGGLGGFSLPSASWEAFGRPLKAKLWPTRTQHGVKLALKTEQKSMNKLTKRYMPFKSDFFRILMDFGWENGAKMVAKPDRKSIATLKAKNQLNASWLVFS